MIQNKYDCPTDSTSQPRNRGSEGEINQDNKTFYLAFFLLQKYLGGAREIGLSCVFETS